MSTLRPELSLAEDNPLNNFLNETLSTRFLPKIKDPRNNELADLFAKALGYNSRYGNGGLMRPDCDPRWTDVLWSAGECGFGGSVNNVRVMYFPHCYAQALEDITKDSDVEFPCGMKIYDVVTSLRHIRKVNKETLSDMNKRGLSINERIEHGYLRCSDIIQLTKYLLNSLLYIMAREGRYTGIGTHHLRESVRSRVADAIRTINKTDGVVIHACNSHIVYVGDQVDIFGVHHESYKQAILIGENGIAYGNSIQTERVTKFLINRDTCNPRDPNDARTMERLAKTVAKKASQCKASVAVYLNLTKEDIDRKYADVIDSPLTML